MNKVNPLLGAFKDPVDPRDFAMRKVMKAVELPPVVDYEMRFKGVRNQQQRGACVSFATVAVKEYQEAKQRKFKQSYDFSEEWVYEQVRQPGGGAFPRDAFKLLVDVGVPREFYMPYMGEIVDDNQEPAFNPGRGAKTNAKCYKASGYARLTTVNDMMQSLFVNGPFMIGVDWLNGWFNDQNKDRDENGYPILKTGDGPVAGGHAICIVGYRMISATVIRFKFRQSWGDTWGKGGYAFFDQEVINSNLNDAWAVYDLANPLINKSAVASLIASK